MADPWDETTPSGSTAPKLGDDYIREFKRAIRERLAVDHEFDSSESPAFGDSGATIGRHSKATLQVQSAAPSVADDTGVLYTKDASGKAELHWKDEDDNEVQLTSAGKLIAPDHGMSTTPVVANVVMGTGSPPTASATPLGTLFLKYTA